MSKRCSAIVAAWVCLTLFPAGRALGEPAQNDAQRAAQWVTEGSEAIASGRLGQGCELHRRAVTKLPAWWVAQLEYAKCARLMGASPEEVLAHLDTALAVEPDKASIHQWRGHVLEDGRRWEDARIAYRRAVELAPHLRIAWQRLADLAFKVGDFDDAVHWYQHWLATYPTSSLAWRRLAEVQWKARPSRVAAESMERAAAYSANPGQIWASAARMYAKLGLSQEAARARSELARIRGR